MKILLSILLLFCLCANSQTYRLGKVSFATAITGWTRPITIVHDSIPTSNQPNFVVLIDKTDNDFKSVSQGGKVKNSTSNNITFSSLSGDRSREFWDFQLWDSNAGRILVNVYIHNASPVTDSFIYVNYGNAAISTYQGNRTSTYNSTYVSTWHLSDGTTLSGADQTANALTLSLVSSPTATSGQVDGAGLTGSAGQFEVISTTFDLTAYTYMTWFNASEGVTGGATRYIFSRGINANNPKSIYLWYDSNNNRWVFGFYNGTLYQDHFYSSAAPVTGQWHHYAVTYGSNLIALYIDGVSVVSEAQVTGPDNTSSQVLKIGANMAGGHWNGIFDETKVFNTRMTDGVTAYYKSEKSPGTCTILGSATTY